jgi:hypothetical protein
LREKIIASGTIGAIINNFMRKFKLTLVDMAQMFAYPRKYFARIVIEPPELSIPRIFTDLKIGTVIFLLVAILCGVLWIFNPPPPDGDSPGLALFALVIIPVIGGVVSWIFIIAISLFVFLIIIFCKKHHTKPWDTSLSIVANTRIASWSYFLLWGSIRVYLALQLLVLCYAIIGAFYVQKSN